MPRHLPRYPTGFSTAVAVTLVAALLMVLPACGTSLPDPDVVYVEPNWAYNGERTEVVVHGSNFYPSVEVDSREAGGRLDQQFDVHLVLGGDTYSLEQVEPDAYTRE